MKFGLLDDRPDEPKPHYGYSFVYGLPKGFLRVAYLQLERRSIRKYIHTIPATFESDPEPGIEPLIAEQPYARKRAP